MADAELEPDGPPAAQLPQTCDERHHLERCQKGAVIGRRDAVDALRNAARRGDLGRDLGAWEDAAINDRIGGCYRATRATMDQCWIRPRYDGYLAFQEAGGDIMESYWRGETGELTLLDRLQKLHASG